MNSNLPDSELNELGIQETILNSVNYLVENGPVTTRVDFAAMLDMLANKIEASVYKALDLTVEKDNSETLVNAELSDLESLRSLNNGIIELLNFAVSVDESIDTPVVSRDEIRKMLDRLYDTKDALKDQQEIQDTMAEIDVLERVLEKTSSFQQIDQSIIYSSLDYVQSKIEQNIEKVLKSEGTSNMIRLARQNDLQHYLAYMKTAHYLMSLGEI